MADWQSIKTEYITTDTSYRKLADKYGLSESYISNKAGAEGWVALRRQHRDKTVTKTLNRISTRQADKMARIDQLSDKLLDKLEQAIEELNVQLLKQVEKTKEIEYNDDCSGKPTKEVVRQEEKLVKDITIVDRQGLKQITAALRDIKEVKMLCSRLDQQEQEARIALLQQKARKDEEGARELVVTFQAGQEEWNE